MKATPVLARTRPITICQLKPWGSRATSDRPKLRRPSMTATKASPMASPSSSPSRFSASQAAKWSTAMGSSWLAKQPQSSGGAFSPLPAQELEQADLGRRQARARRRALQSSERIARIILHRIEQRGMYVGLAADRRRVAERFGDRLDHRLDADPRMLALLQQLLEGDDARAPGAEMLGGEVAAARLANVIVDVARGDGLRLAVAVHILEQHLPGELLTAPDDALQMTVGDGHFADDPTLAGKAHHELVALAPKVPAAQGRRAEALVRLGIFLVADADMLGVEQADDGREHRIAAELAPLEISFDPAAQPRQGLAELAQAFVFRAVPLLAIVGMIAILLAPAGIDSSGLEVAVGIRAEPRVLVGGGQADGVQPVDLVAVGDP